MNAITVNNLSKCYRIGLEEERTDSLAEAITGWMKTPLRAFKRLKRLSSAKAGDDLFWALKDINFEVMQGEVLGVIGKNGAGKSTLLKILSRITEPTTGTIEINGRVNSLLEVGTGFHPELTGRENVFLNGTILGMKKKEVERKFDEILAFSGVEKFIDTPVKRYSSGMKVRLAFAVAAHLEPEILIIDEVLAVGDAEFQKKCLGKMQDVSSQGRTVLFVSHNMGALQDLCSRAILLENGKLTRTGACDEIVDYYLNDIVKTYQKVHYEFDSPDKKNSIKSFKFITDKSSPNFFNHEDISAEVDFILEEEGKDVDVNISIFNRRDKIFMIFASDVSNKGFGHEQPFVKGENKVKFKIPAGFLNKGDYSIKILLHKAYKEKLDARKDEISFQVLSSDKRFLKYPTIPAGPVNLFPNQS